MKKKNDKPFCYIKTVKNEKDNGNITTKIFVMKGEEAVEAFFMSDIDNKADVIDLDGTTGNMALFYGKWAHNNLHANIEKYGANTLPTDTIVADMYAEFEAKIKNNRG